MSTVTAAPERIVNARLDGSLDEGVARFHRDIAAMIGFSPAEYPDEYALAGFLGVDDSVLMNEVFVHEDGAYSVRVTTGFGVYGPSGHVWFEVSDNGTVTVERNGRDSFHNPGLARDMMREYRARLAVKFADPIPA